MPFMETAADGTAGRAYYRHWAAGEPRAAGVDLWAVDQFGHGLTPGDRGDFRSLEASGDLADGLTDLAAAKTPGIPLVAQGHSFGAVVTLFRLLADPKRYRAAVVSGAPLIAVPQLVDSNTAFEILPGQLSADPFYLDSIENDPLAFTDADGASMARELDRGWDRFGAELPALAVPTLAIHGSNDPIAPVGALRAYAEQIEPLSLTEIPGGGHDILNDVSHRRVASAIIAFIGEQT